MSVSQIVQLLGGIALFLFGMTLMGDGLKKASGSKLEPILFRLSGTPLRGLLLGTGVTAILQSSCATSVMAVGFVNSGMMKLRQSVGVILGSMLGTSITGWIICLSYLDSASALGSILSTRSIIAAAAVSGVILHLYCRTPGKQHTGVVLMGFAVLMLGMSTMSGAMEALGSQPGFIALLTSMTHPVPAFIVGALFTAVLQSASAAVGILQALSVTGAITFETAFPLLLGINVGASVPVLLSAIGAGTDGKRAAFIYPIAAVAGSAVCGILYIPLCSFFIPAPDAIIMDPFSLAGANTVFRLVMVCLLAPMIGLLTKIVCTLIPERAEAADADAPHLEERFLAHPALALEQCGIAVGDMAVLSEQSFILAVGLLRSYGTENFDRVVRLEEAADRYEDALGSYLMKLTGQELSPDESRTVTCFLHVLTDLERISDHARNIAESAAEQHDKSLTFSPEALSDLTVVTDAVMEIVHMTIDAFSQNDLAAAARVEPLEEIIDGLCDQLRSRHIERLQHGKCTLMNGFVLNDLATDLERVSDHCSNIAGAMLAPQTAEPGTHHLRMSDTEDFRSACADYARRYAF